MLDQGQAWNVGVCVDSVHTPSAKISSQSFKGRSQGRWVLRQSRLSSQPDCHCFYFLCVQRHPPPNVSLCICLLCHLREDEHALIQQYCQTLGGESPVSQPQSPAQILKSVEREERGELERIIADLEEEQRCARLRRNQEVFHPGKTSHGKSFRMPFHMALMHSFFSTAVQGVLWRQSFRGH